jgi:glycosyltransferase involved in cell wall biosynthesis
VSTMSSCVAAQQAGIATSIAAVEGRGPMGVIIDRLGAEGVVVESFPLARRMANLARRWSISPSLVRWVFRHAREFDVVHAHGAWTFTTLGALVVAKLHRRMAVLTPHESLTDFDIAKSRRCQRLVKKELRRLYLKWFDAVVFASELERESSAANRASGYVAVIPHALEPMNERSRAYRGVSPLIVGFLGRLDPKKNLDVLIRALPVNARLRIAGDGSSDVIEALRKLSASVGADDRIEWLGFVRDQEKMAFLQSIDVLAMPSAYEGFGLAAAEALRAGVPVIVSPRTGIAALVKRYGCGWVVPATSQEFRAVLEQRDEIRNRSGRATFAADRELGLKSHGERLRVLYSDLLLTRASRIQEEVR